MASPQNSLSRKRRQVSPSSLSPYPSTCRFTRSKSRSLLHRSRSGRSWPGRTPPFQQQQQPHLMADNLVESPSKMDLKFDGIDASPCVSVQTKCSGRARSQVRVSTILSSNGVVIERESDKFGFAKEFGGKGCPPKGLESDVHLDLGCKSFDSGLSESEKNNKDLVPVSKDPDIEPVVQLDKEGGSSKDTNGCSLDKRNAPKPVRKLGRVFKAPASLNYRRLLPFLAEMAKNDSSTPCNTQNVEILETSLPSDLVTCGVAKNGDAKENSDTDMQLEERNSQDSGFQHPVEGHDVEEPPNHSTQMEGQNEVVYTSDRTNNSNNGIEDIGEDCFQTTPPDAAILSKFGIDDKRELGERKTPYLDIQLFGLKPPNITCKEYVSDAGNSQQSASQQKDSSPKTKPILNRCSQVKIFKSSSFSYRRLLPYLMDVSKGASYIHQSPKLENDFPISSESPSSVDVVSVEKIRHTDLNEKVHAEKQASNACVVAPPPVDASSTPADASLSAPVDASLSAPVDASLSALVNASSALVDASSAPVNASLSALVDASSAPVDASLSALVDASSAPVDASSAPVDASSALVDASSAPVDASLSALVDASSAPVDASSAPVDASLSALVDASSAPVDDSNLNPLASTDNSATGGTNATSETATVESDMQLCVQLERTVQDEAVTAKTDVQLPFHSETAIQHKKRKLKRSELICSVETSSSTTKSELLSVEPISEVSQHQPENGCCLLESATSNNGLLLGEGFDLYDTQNHSHIKGILKRNPRGCRGLCNCLNCSSFRLHAERSFEFSRNQLLDAEELAFGLIDELATLRNLLEKNVGDGCDVAAIKCNQPQVKEACRKALIREQVAKQQLTQMNEELNVHCRHAPLLRPRVTFSERIEERVFSKETVKVVGTRHQ